MHCIFYGLLSVAILLPFTCFRSFELCLRFACFWIHLWLSGLQSLAMVVTSVAWQRQNQNKNFQCRLPRAFFSDKKRSQIYCHDARNSFQIGMLWSTNHILIIVMRCQDANACIGHCVGADEIVRNVSFKQCRFFFSCLVCKLCFWTLVRILS